MVSWRTPNAPNGNIHKYTVYRREVSNGEQVEVRESSVLSGPNYLELSSLQSNRRYDIWVKAATNVGYGPASVITSIILGRIGTYITEWGENICAAAINVWVNYFLAQKFELNFVQQIHYFLIFIHYQWMYFFAKKQDICTVVAGFNESLGT